MKNNYTERQKAIVQLIQSHAVEDQSTIKELLVQEYNLHTNQAAISRDLRNLGIFKKVRDKRLIYELPQVDTVTEILHYAIQSVRHNETTIVIHTAPGTAALVGDFLDQQDDLAILGTLAGENVVFITPQSIKNITQIFDQICERLKIKV